jgi:glycosyltransferase involved in cell wall biosynthesis
LKPALEKLAKNLKVEDRIRFYHDLPRRELLQKYADADVFALLSKHEAYSIVVAEALVAGTPVVVTRTSALSEWIDNRTCFGVDYPISLNELADRINRALESKVDRKSTAKWNGTKILDWNDVVERLEKVYFA